MLSNLQPITKVGNFHRKEKPNLNIKRDANVKFIMQ